MTDDNRPLEPAEDAKLEAETEKHRAERDHFRAHARKETAPAVGAEITANAKQREEKNELAKDTHHRVFVFDKPVTATSRTPWWSKTETAAHPAPDVGRARACLATPLALLHG